MKKKGIILKLCLSGFFLMSGVVASAQWSMGVQAGYTHSYLDISSGYMYDYKYKPLGGFTVGVPVRYSFFDWLDVQADVSYVQKNYKKQRSSFNGLLSTDTHNHYLQLPLFARFSFGGYKVRGFLSAGGYMGYWLSSRVSGIHALSGVFPESKDNDIYYFDEKMPFNSERDNRFEAGLTGGVGEQYQATPKIQFFVEGRYYHGLTDMQKKYQYGRVPRYNSTIAFQIGCMFNLY